MKHFAIVLLFLGTLSIASAQTDDLDKIKSKLPHLLGANNAGTEFMLTFHPCWEEFDPNNGIRIYVTSAFATQVNLYIPALGGKQAIMSKKTIANDVIEFVLSPSAGQCYSRGAGAGMPPLPSQVFKGRGVIIESDAPIICYGVVRFAYYSDGFLALPVNVLGKEYKVAAYTQTTDGSGQYLNGYTSAVGAYDNTTVNFTLHGNNATFIFNEKSVKVNNGETLTRTLNRGDVWLLAGMGPFNDISGSFVTADKPFALISGNHCVFIPMDAPECDYTIEQDIPMEAWGTKYHVPPIYTRKKSSIIRIYPSAKETNLYRDNQLFDVISSHDTNSRSNFRECRANLDSAKPAVISADSTIGITLYNTGILDDFVSTDPFQMSLIPIHQYSKEILFNTPGIKGSLGFTSNYLTVVYLSDDQGKIPDDFMFGKVAPGGIIKWEKVSDISSIAAGRFNDLDPVTNREYKFLTILLPEDGVYSLKANNAFAAYSYGFNKYDSYGFPAGNLLLTGESNSDRVNPPIVTSESGLNGTISGVATGSLSINGDRPANLSFLYMIAGESSNYEFSAENFIPGQTNQANWNLNVKTLSKPAKAVILVANRIGQDTVLIYRYEPTGVEETANPGKYISIFPMPVRDKSNLVYECLEAGPADIDLVDMNGKTVQTIARGEYLEKGNIRRIISSNALPSGAYTLRIAKNGKLETRAVVIEK